ncbi:TOMM precursor leader peptide-binding protein [Streptantibioticus rubrisoli]|uniref:TOMM leader peptide-binding protein n=1 Tax=Streptantibioticus rubrisoli TaxID=1387313 RepID=A0ABT1PBN3_9ACTN|nr:TOMM precursor leader peptide-binding protein [Streptantibioticus rubrisoli]MCQ4042782.1 TOMM precursor leader peptide-binding protein [Streptantibioticus rubrisoli]
MADLAAAFQRPAALVALAAWRPVAGACELADQYAFRNGTAWLPVVLDHPVLRVGPLVQPPCAPCYRCFRRRQLQHDAEHRTTSLLHAAYEGDSGLGPRGYLPYQARMAAALAADLAAAGMAAVGEVRELNLFDQRLHLSRVVPCHDCRRCGPGEGAGPVERIGPVLERLGRSPLAPTVPVPELAVGEER